MSNSISNNIPKVVILQSLLVAFYADMKCINWTITYGYSSVNVEAGYMSILYPGVILMSLIFAMIGKNNISKRLSITCIIIVSILLLFYIATLSFIGPPKIGISMFLVMVIASLLLPNIIRVNARIMIKGIMFFPFFAIFRQNRVFASVSSWQEVLSMETSYAFLVPIIATIGYLFFYFKEENSVQRKLTLLLSTINMVYFFQIVQYGSRGPILSVLLFLVVLYVIKTSQKGISVRHSSLFLVIIGAIMLVFTFSTSIPFVNEALNTIGLNVHALDKIIRLSEEGDITNGREVINSITWSGIIESPFFGHGLDRFDANTGLLYPHNFILQILYDGGVLLLLVLMVPVIVCSTRILRTCSKDEYAVFVILMFSSVPGALFSGDMWGVAGLWLFFGFILSRYFVIEEDKYSY